MPKNKKIKAVLFDLDGVLVDSLNAWFYVTNDTLKHFGFRPVPKKEFERDFGAPIEYEVKKRFAGKTINEVALEYNLNFKKRKHLVKLFSHSVEVLKELKKQKIKLALISNSTRFIVMTVLNHYKIRRYFDAVITMNDAKRRKPAPDMVLKACKMLKIAPENAMLIGDTINDMLAAKRAGCIAVGYKTKGDLRINGLKQVMYIENFVKFAF